MSPKQIKIKEKCASTNTSRRNLSCSYIKGIWMKILPIRFMEGEIRVTEPEITKPGTRNKNTKRSFWIWLAEGTAAEELHQAFPCSFLHHLGKQQHHWVILFEFWQLSQQPAQELPKYLLLINLPWKETKYIHSGSQSDSTGNFRMFQF